MIKDVIFPVTNTAGDANAFAAAIALAIHYDAHLNVLEFANLPLPPTGPWGSGEFELGDIYRTCRIDAETDAVAWRERLTKESISSEVRVCESVFTESAGLAALHAHCSDLIVMTMATGILGDASIIGDWKLVARSCSCRRVLHGVPRNTPRLHGVRHAKPRAHCTMPYLCWARQSRLMCWKSIKTVAMDATARHRVAIQ